MPYAESCTTPRYTSTALFCLQQLLLSSLVVQSHCCWWPQPSSWCCAGGASDVPRSRPQLEAANTWLQMLPLQAP
jgi:hypothetical protein